MFCYKPMTRLFGLLLLLLAMAQVQGNTSIVAVDELRPSFNQIQSMLLTRNVFEQYHYSKRTLDDSFSNAIFDAYLGLLDPNRSFLTAEEVERFRAEYANRLDDDILNGKLDPAFTMYKTFREAVERQTDYALRRLQQSFDFETEGMFDLDRTESDWVANQHALDELWSDRVHNDVLTLTLAGKTDKEIQDDLTKRYQGLLRRTQQRTSDDVFLLFMTAYASAIEPHTGYMLPRAAENFDISMSLSLEGIGAVLSGDTEYTEVQKVVPGGPADLSGQLHAGDRIIGIAQGRRGKMQDVVGWRLQDVVEQVRGKKGSVVRLLVMPKAGAPGVTREISLVRDTIRLEDQAAQSFVLGKEEGFGNLKIGVIKLPTFYRDFQGASGGDKEFRSTTRDVRELLTELQAQGVDGILIDLRDNGGGSLTEATELTSLFIGNGPVVQIKDYRGKIETERDAKSDIVYDGPLAVLVNRNSASASEIFSAAIQDYGRGIVIGEPTFGKGTVQQLVELSNMIAGSNDLGRVRVTIAQFFRVNGGSTQHRGVVPDIQFPTVIEVDYGERALTNALPWTSIQKAKYQEWTLGDLASVRERSAERIAADAGFAYLIYQSQLLQDLKTKKTVSLNEEMRRREWNFREELRMNFHNAYRRSVGLPILSYKEFQEEDAQVLEKRREEEKLDRVEMLEAARILADIVRQNLYPEIRSAQVPADSANAAVGL